MRACGCSRVPQGPYVCAARPQRPKIHFLQSALAPQQIIGRTKNEALSFWFFLLLPFPFLSSVCVEGLSTCSPCNHRRGRGVGVERWRALATDLVGERGHGHTAALGEAAEPVEEDSATVLDGVHPHALQQPRRRRLGVPDGSK